MRGLLLLARVDEDHGAVAGAAAEPGPCGVVKLQEDLQQLVVGDAGGIELDPDRLDVPGRPVATWS